MKSTSKTRTVRPAGPLAAGFLAVTAYNAQALPPVNATPQQIVHQGSGHSPKVVSKVHQPAGTSHKVSSFAPHPTTRRVFGDPIQPPILGNAAAKDPHPK
jgi:hypothetical protein